MNKLTRKNLFFSLLFLVQISFVNGQNCLPGYTTLDDQNDIDNFSTNYPGCTNIEGSLRIDPSSSGTITNLNGLSQLISIGEDLHIENGAEITDFSGLDNLVSIGGDLETFGGVVSNSTLTSFNGLGSLQSIGGKLRIGGIYQNLTTLNGLNSLNSIGSDIQIGLDALNDISALSSITTVNGNLSLAWNDVLSNLSGLDNVTSISGNLIIIISPQLLNLDALSSLTNVGGYVQIRNNSMLANLNGLSSLTSIGGELDISLVSSLNDATGLSNLTSINGRLRVSNSSLSSLTGLENIDKTGITDLVIENNSSLTMCEVESICDYLDIPANTATINNNDTDCNTRPEIEAACLLALPVELIEFTGQANKNQINLNWETASELNNYGFEIEKSTNGRDWNIINFIEGKGTTTEINKYQYRDLNPFSGVNYYRLKQVDFDGAFEYSKIIVVEFTNSAKGINIFPNPSNGLVNLQIDNPSNQRTKIIIIDNLGRKILESELIEGESNWRKEIEIEINGIHFVVVQIGDEIYYRQIIITDGK